jgi:hypothetical protein
MHFIDKVLQQLSLWLDDERRVNQASFKQLYREAFTGQYFR